MFTIHAHTCSCTQCSHMFTILTQRHTHALTHMLTQCLHTCSHTDTYRHTLMHRHTHAHTHSYTDTRMITQTHMCSYIHAHTDTHMLTHTHVIKNITKMQRLISNLLPLPPALASVESTPSAPLPLMGTQVSQLHLVKLSFILHLCRQSLALLFLTQRCHSATCSSGPNPVWQSPSPPSF